MKKLLFIPLISLVILGVSCLSPAQEVEAPDEPEKTGRQIAVRLADRNESRQSGSAIFSEVNDVMELKIDLQNGKGIQPAVVMSGSCESIEEKRYDLAEIEDGMFEGFFPQEIDEFESNRPMAIIVYESEENSTITSCGDIGPIFE